VTVLRERLRPVRALNSTDVFCLVLAVAVVVKLAFGNVFSTPAVSAWTTVFAAICVQAAPFLALGVLISTAIAVFVPPSFFQRALPRRSSLAVPVAGLAGCALPGCECGSVPIAAALISRGVAAGPAIAFLLSAPAINPVVLTATAVAFPGHPLLVLARFSASLLTALVVGWVWPFFGRRTPIGRTRERPAGSDSPRRATRARITASHDLAQSLGLLCIGAAGAATLNVTVPRRWLDGLSGSPLVSLITLSLLAVLIAVCSEADAFIASSLIQFPLTARLAFMVVGPAIDVKLFALQAGTFGWRVALRLAPLTLFVATGCAALVGGLLL
jgi:uncharacterized membrane protein YraQ (UPF0718 family)